MFNQHDGDHQDLHSFPTRRSSDLALTTGISLGKSACSGARRRISRHVPSPERKIRSEEHTSELQSRRDLVCRLLLEKKKQTPSYRCVRPLYRRWCPRTTCCACQWS